MSRDEKTYGQVRQRYDEWIELQQQNPRRERIRRTDTYTPPPTPGSQDMSRIIFTAIGVGIGLVLLLLAAFAFRAASYWADFGREGATTGYVLIGFFLLVAGLGGIIGTWNHNFRVLSQPPRQH